MKVNKYFDEKTGIITLECDVNEDISEETINPDGHRMTPMGMNTKGWKQMALRILLEDYVKNEDDSLDKNLAQLESAIICDFCGINSTPIVRKLDGTITGVGDSHE